MSNAFTRKSRRESSHSAIRFLRAVFTVPDVRDLLLQLARPAQGDSAPKILK